MPCNTATLSGCPRPPWDAVLGCDWVCKMLVKTSRLQCKNTVLIYLLFYFISFFFSTVYRPGFTQPQQWHKGTATLKLKPIKKKKKRFEEDAFEDLKGLAQFDYCRSLMVNKIDWTHLPADSRSPLGGRSTKTFHVLTEILAHFSLLNQRGECQCVHGAYFIFTSIFLFVCIIICTPQTRQCLSSSSRYKLREQMIVTQHRERHKRDYFISFSNKCQVTGFNK